MPAPIVGVAAAAAARLVAKKLATKTAKKAVTSSARVRKNTNAVTGAAKVKDNYPQQLTNALQKRSVKKVAATETTRKTAPKTANNIDSLMADARKTVKPNFEIKSGAKKVVAKRATLNAKQQRAIEAERRFGSSKFDWR
jgi:hypothetical protein